MSRGNELARLLRMTGDPPRLKPWGAEFIDENGGGPVSRESGN